jgi:Transglutaminase-like superfamily
MADRMAKFLSLNRHEKGIFIASCFLLPLVWMALRPLGFRRTRNLLSLFGRGKDVISSIDEARRLSYLVNTASNNGLRRANCLERSLLLWWLLHRKGVAANIRFGASNVSRSFKAHAWVEWNGVILNDRASIASEFAPFPDASGHLMSSEIPVSAPGGAAPR